MEEIHNMQGMENNLGQAQIFDLLVLDDDLIQQGNPREHPQNPHIGIVSYINGAIIEILRLCDVLCRVVIVKDPGEIVKC